MTDNIKALQKEIDQATVSRKNAEVLPSGGSETANDTAKAAEGEGQKIVIEHLLAKGGSVKAKLSVIPTTPPIPLPDIELRNLGKSDDGEEAQGADISTVLTKISDTFYDTIIGTVSSATGFGMDALKSAGALIPLGSSTNGVINADISPKVSGLSKKRPAAEAAFGEGSSVMDESAQETNKKRSSFFHKRRWMR
jgi:hypothetical protein